MKNFKGKEYQPRSSRDIAGERKSSSTDYKDVECFGCGKKGHYKTDCPEISYAEMKALRAKRDKNFGKKKAMVAGDTDGSTYTTSDSTSSDTISSDEEDGAYMRRGIGNPEKIDLSNSINETEDKTRRKKKWETDAPKSIWYLDSGCSKHMTGVKDYLTQYVEKAGSKVAIGDNSLGETKGHGVLNMGNVCISNVNYVSGLKHNLLSVSQFCDSGFSVNISKDEFIVMNNLKHGKAIFTLYHGRKALLKHV